MLKASSSRLETVRVVRTALNPLLWLVGIVSPLALALTAVVSDAAFRFALLGFAGAPVMVTIAAYFILMFREPDRLQSEEFRLRQIALRLIMQKNSDAEIVEREAQLTRIEDVLRGFGDGVEK